MTTYQAQRPRFFEGQYLGARDLMAIIQHSDERHARLSLGAHTWGIAVGLGLMETPALAGDDEVDVYVQPGYAWDGFGRPIVVLAPSAISGELFKRFTFDSSNPDGRLVEVWLRYQEQNLQAPAPGFELCEEGDHFARIQESFRIEIGERRNHADRHDPVSVAGYEVDAQEALQRLDPADSPLYDESVPYQVLPGNNSRPFWLIPLGYVRWQPDPDPLQPGRFVALINDEPEASRQLRRYIGVVAEAVQAADGIIRLRDRASDPSQAPRSDDLVWVEGNLRIDKNTRLFGGNLEFLDAGGQHNGAPLTLERIEDNGRGRDLRVTIGQDNTGNNRFVVGSDVSGSFETRIAVLDDGNVGVGAEIPEHKLQIGDATDDISLSLRGPDGKTESSVLAFEDDGGTIQRWFKFTHDTVDNKLKLSSAEVDPILTFDRLTGNIGIGLVSPDRQLHIKQAESNSTNGLRLENADNSRNLRLWVGTSGAVIDAISGANLQLQTNGINRLFIRNNSGNVGIGTVTPDRELHIKEAASTSTNGFRLENADNSRNLRLWVGSGGAVVDAFSGANLHLRTNGIDRLLIRNNSGNVGVGTFNPREKLEVRGKIRLSSNGNLFAVGALESMRIITGRVNANGSRNAGPGFTVSRIATGRYRVIFDDPFDSPPFVLVTPSDPGTGDDNAANTFSIIEGQFQVRIVDIDPSANNQPEDAPFDFVALGSVS